MKQNEPGTVRAHAGTAETDMDFNAMLAAVAENQDQQSFIRLFEYFAPRVKSFLMKGGTPEETADELAQETMLAVWDKAAGFNPHKAAASTWIFTIARNKKIDYLRKAGRAMFEPADTDFLESDTPQPFETLQNIDETETLARALETLPEEQARLLRQSFFEDKSHSEIAAEAGMPLGTVKSRIRLALERLRKNRKVRELW